MVVTSELEKRTPLLYLSDLTAQRRHRYCMHFFCVWTSRFVIILIPLQLKSLPVCAMSSCENPVWPDKCASTELCLIDIGARSRGQCDLPWSISSIGICSSHNFREISIPHWPIFPARARTGNASSPWNHWTTDGIRWRRATSKCQRNLEDSKKYIEL